MISKSKINLKLILIQMKIHFQSLSSIRKLKDKMTTINKISILTK